jgi:hypothetical protein
MVDSEIFRIALKPIKFGLDLEPISVGKLMEAAKIGVINLKIVQRIERG